MATKRTSGILMRLLPLMDQSHMNTQEEQVDQGQTVECSERQRKLLVHREKPGTEVREAYLKP